MQLYAIFTCVLQELKLELNNILIYMYNYILDWL